MGWGGWQAGGSRRLRPHDTRPSAHEASRRNRSASAQRELRRLLDHLAGRGAVDLSTLRGPLVINLWQSACEACKHEMPILQAFHEKYGGQVAVLGIDSTDTFPGEALEQLKDRGVTYPQLADPDGDLQETAAFAQVRGYPHLTFVDADGDIAYEKSGAVQSADELESLVEEHLGVSL